MKRTRVQFPVVLFVLLILPFLTGCFGPQRPAPVTTYGTQVGAGTTGVHTVSSDETLWSISSRYKIAMQDIIVGNDLRAPFQLSIGQRIKLPPPKTYRVRRGDTLYKVSRLFGVSSSQIARQNNLRSPYVLRVGQVLKLPSISGGTAAPPKARVYQASVSQRAGQFSDGEQLIARGPVLKQAEPIEREALPPQKNVLSVPQESENDILQAPSEPFNANKDVDVRSGSFKKAVAKTIGKPPPRASSRFLQPVSGKIVSSYGPKANGLHNDGINITAPLGMSVRSAENGIVVYAGNGLKGSGNLVLVRHDDRWMTAYAHLDRIDVKRGDVLNRGDVLGKVGRTGGVETPQLHFEIRRGTEALNPKLYMEL